MTSPGSQHPSDVFARDLLARYRAVGDAAASAERPQFDAAAAAADAEAGYASGSEASPAFTFTPLASGSRTAELAQEAFTAASLHDDPLLEAFGSYLMRQGSWTYAVASHDPDLITQVSLAEHGPVTAGLLERARDLLDSPTPPQPAETITPEQAAVVLDEVLAELGASDWSTVVAGDMVARMSVSPARCQVRLNRDALFSQVEVERLAVHEVGVHVARSLHGASQSSPLLAVGIGEQHMLAEEGLAVWAESQLGVLSPLDLRKYALRVVAVDAALAGGFASVYAAVRPFTAARPAFDITLRVKRAMADTSGPGAFVKDKVYLEGFEQASELLAARPGLAPLLWSGKVSFAMLPVVEQLHREGRITPRDLDPLGTCRRLLDRARTCLA